MAKAKKKNVTSAIDLRTSLEGISQWVVLFFFAVFPLLIGTQGVYGNITYSKFIYFLIATLVYLGVAIFVIYRAYAKDKTVLKSLGQSIFKKPSISQILIVAYMLWSLVSAIASKYPFSDTLIGSSRYEALISIWLYGILFLLISEFGKHSDTYFYGMAIMAIVMGVLGLLQIFGSTILYPEGRNYANSHFISTIGNVDCFANIVALIIPALIGAFIYCEGKFRWLTLPGALILFFDFLVTDVDNGKTGLIAALIIALPFILDSLKHILRTIQSFSVLLMGFVGYKLYYLIKHKAEDQVIDTKKYIIGMIVCVACVVAVALLERKAGNKVLPLSQKTIRIAVAIILVLAIIFALVYVYKYQGERKIIKEFSMLMHGEITDKMGSNRGYIWKSSFEIVKANPIFGCGPGTYAKAFEPFNEGYHALQSNTNVDQAHSDFIHIAASQGLVGLALYLAFLLSVIIRGIKSINKENKAAVYLVAIVGFLGAVTFVFSIAIVSPLFWVSMGLLEHLYLDNNRVEA